MRGHGDVAKVPRIRCTSKTEAYVGVESAQAYSCRSPHVPLSASRLARRWVCHDAVLAPQNI